MVKVTILKAYLGLAHLRLALFPNSPFEFSRILHVTHCRMANAMFHEYEQCLSLEAKLEWRRTRGPLDAAFFRTQLSQIQDPKVRHVFGRPFHLLWCELIFCDVFWLTKSAEVNTPSSRPALTSLSKCISCLN